MCGSAVTLCRPARELPSFPGDPGCEILARPPPHYAVSVVNSCQCSCPKPASPHRYLLQSGSKGPPHSVVDVLPMVGGRVYTSLERSHNRQDFLEDQLAREVENGRLFRLLAKLGVITERPE